MSLVGPVKGEADDAVDAYLEEMYKDSPKICVTSLEMKDGVGYVPMRRNTMDKKFLDANEAIKYMANLSNPWKNGSGRYFAFRVAIL